MTHTHVLLITVDDMNYNTPGFAGGKPDGITPNIDRLAAEGFYFAHAHVTIAVCQPSRSALMTGKYPHRNGAMGYEPIADGVVPLTERLRRAGYFNGIIGKEDQLAPRETFGWDVYVQTLDEDNGYGRDPGVYYNYARSFFEQAKAAGKPFFLMANSHDPHRPFAGSAVERKRWGANTKVSRQYGAEDVDVPRFLPDLPDVRTEIAEYCTSARRADETVGEILRALRESGEADNTLVMFLSDNGMSFPFAKTNCYLNSTRTPWIVRWPGKVRTGSVDRAHMIAGIDCMPTVLDALGLAPEEGLDGVSFLPLLLGETQPGRDRVFTMFNRTAKRHDYPMRCLQNRKHGYIWNAWSEPGAVFRNESQSGLTFRAMTAGAERDPALAGRVEFFLYRSREELYDFETDPDALRNLIDLPEYKDVVDRFRGELLRYMASSADPLADRFRSEFGLASD